MNTNDDASLGDADRQVRAVLDRIYAAWAAGDAHAFVAPYAETASAILPGSHLPSKEAIRATMATLFGGQLKGSRAVHEVLNVRFLGQKAAVVINKGGIVFPGQAEPDPGSMSLETWVLSRRDGAWRVEAFQNSPLNAA